MTEQTFTISELSQEFNITPRAIRFYEDLGLLSPVRKGQQRIYNKSDYVRLKLIIRGKRLGFSLAESRELIELYDPATRNKRQLKTMLTTIEQSSERIDQQLQDIQAMKQELDEARKRCIAALQS